MGASGTGGARAPESRLEVGVLGATGSVGQRFVQLLADHPWFRPTVLAASPASAGKRYGEHVRWSLSTPLPPAVAGLTIERSDEVRPLPLVFSGLDSDVAGPIERAWSRAGALVVSNTKTHRMEPDVPLVVPEVNPGHVALLEARPEGEGGILANPNCSTIGLVLALQPLVARFGVKRAHVVTLQALSGAGLDGPTGLQMIDNLVPLIGGEEEKIERETGKLLGRLEGGAIRPAAVEVSATCTRVPVLDGHTECVSVELERDASADELIAAWDGFRALPQELGLPSAPRRPTIYHEAPDAPQPRLHRDLGRGMSASVGRLRRCPLFGWKFVTLSHNTVRGAAGGAILCAELAVARGLVRS